jgi:hypothetical protein
MESLGDTLQEKAKRSDYTTKAKMEKERNNLSTGFLLEHKRSYVGERY